MKLFAFLLLALASLVKAEHGALRQTEEIADENKPVVPDQRGIGPRFLGKVTFNREYNEDGEPPAGRQVDISPDHPAEEPDDEDETLGASSRGDSLGPSSRALSEFRNRKLGKKKKKKKSKSTHHDDAYNCYDYCWWHSYYGWITYCCPWWGCGYYYC